MNANEYEKAAARLLDRLLQEDWWNWEEGELCEMMEKAGIVDYVEFKPGMAIEDAEEGDMVYVLREEFRK
jgi:hypothetical protein